MQIREKKIKIRDIVKEFFNDDEEGVTGYDDQLDIRPQYQREFVYDDRKRNEVIRTVMRGLPLNVMYWADRGQKEAEKNGIPRYELMDGQQRTISICLYRDNDFSVDGMYFGNLPKDKQEQFLDYELTIYICSGAESEKLEWFKIINITGEKLTDQELRNAVYSGSWVSSLKKYFSKTGCAAYNVGGDYLSGTSIRQDYLETVLEWCAERDGVDINEYMACHQSDASGVAEWRYFRDVIDWVKDTFPKYRKEMKGIEWGILYNHNKDRRDLNGKSLEKQVSKLMADEDVTKKSGIYLYLLDSEERHLNIRVFTPRMKREAYERQKGICPVCGNHFEIDEMQADHITPWSRGGTTTPDNCQMLCAKCNREKSNK